MTLLQVIIAATVLTLLGAWLVKADPVGKAACHAVCVAHVEGY